MIELSSEFINIVNDRLKEDVFVEEGVPSLQIKDKLRDIKVKLSRLQIKTFAKTFDEMQE